MPVHLPVNRSWCPTLTTDPMTYHKSNIDSGRCFPQKRSFSDNRGGGLWTRYSFDDDNVHGRGDGGLPGPHGDGTGSRRSFFSDPLGGGNMCLRNRNPLSTLTPRPNRHYFKSLTYLSLSENTKSSDNHPLARYAPTTPPTTGGRGDDRCGGGERRGGGKK